jgi:hypothetical protein
MTERENTLQLTAVPSPVVDVVWGDVKHMLNRAVNQSNGLYKVQDIYEAIMAGRLGLWVVLDGEVPVAALTTRISAYPEARVLAVDWIAGSRMKEWLPLVHATYEDYARSYGCSRIEGRGRKGWLRELSKHGWKMDHMSYSVEISNE